jgi:putative SOS response-associated peptidase YedK
MCTNYRPTSRDWLAQRLGAAAAAFDYEAEAYPGYAAPMLRRRGPGHAGTEVANPAPAGIECVKACFGLIPFWSQDTKISRMTYNARSETAREKPSFRQAWSRRQWCLVPMESFYEPNYESGRAVRWRIERSDHAPFMVAGLWDRWVAPHNGETVWSFSMLTIIADDHPLMRRFHRPAEEKRSVAVIDDAQAEAWLAATPEDALALLRPMPVDRFTAQEAPAPPRRKGTPPIAT